MEESLELQAQRNEANIFHKTRDCFYDCALLNIMLGVLSIIFVNLAYDSIENKISLSFAVILIIAYIIEVFYSNTFSFLYHKMNYQDAQKIIVDLSQLRGSIKWTIECYHYEKRTTYVTKNGATRTKTTTKKVTTSTHTASFDYGVCEDKSIFDDAMNHLGILELCRVYLTQTYEFADSHARESFNSQKQNFLNTNKNRDEKYSFSESFNIPGFISRIITYGGQPNDSPPIIFNVCIYLLCSTLLLGWIIRIILYKKSFATTGRIIKKLHSN